MQPSSQPELQILYEDEHILVVNKPAGLLTIPDGYDAALPHVSGLLKKKYDTILTVHRLDRTTSGVIVFARTPAAHRSLSLQFENRLTKKHYHAIARGIPDWPEKMVALPLKVNGDRKHRTVVSETDGKPATTLLTILNRYGEVCLVQAIPFSGYTHQIRVHMAAVGLPLIADSLYAPKNTPAHLTGLIDRPALHACTLKFTHPVNQQALEFNAAYPPDFAQALSILTRGIKK